MSRLLGVIRDTQRTATDERDGPLATDMATPEGFPVHVDPAGGTPETAGVEVTNRTATVIVDIAVLVVCGALGVMLAVGYAGPGRLLLTVVFASAVPGWALLSRIRNRDWIVSGALTLGLSWTLCTTGAVAMLWLRLWDPVVLFAVLGSVSCGLVGERLVDSLRASPEATSAGAAPGPGIGSASLTPSMPDLRRRLGPTDALPLAAAALWVGALRAIRLKPMSDFGLLPLLPVVYWLALAVVVGSFAWLLRPGRLSPFRLAAHVVLLVVFLHGTIPVLFTDPRYTWVYTHFGVVNYLMAHGRVNQAVDIYNNWPGFFALAAWVTKLSGEGSPIRYGAWAPVYFNLTGALSFGFVVSALTPSSRKRWLAVFVFVASSWVGEDYFAPQAFAYVLCMLIFGIIIRWCGAPGNRWLHAGERAGRRLVRGRVGAPVPTGEIEPPPHPALVGAVVFSLFAIVVVSHQLSPYMLILGVGLLTVAGLVRPRWMVLGLGAIAIGYLAPHFTYVNRTYGLLNAIGNPFRNSQPRMALSQGSAGRVFVADATRILSASMWALAAIGGVRRWRRGLPTIGLLLLAGAPGLAFFFLSYGGEAIYRVFLFSLPWTAFLAVEAIAPREDDGWSVTALIRIGLTAMGLVALFIPAYFGLESVYQVRPTEVLASEYFYAHAAPGTRLVLAAPNFPSRLAANYDEHISRGAPYDPVLFVNRLLSDHLLGPGDLDLIDGVVAGDEPDTATAGYLVISTSMKAYCEEYGLAPPGALDDLDQLLSHAPRWRAVYRNADAVVFELLPPGASA